MKHFLMKTFGRIKTYESASIRQQGKAGIE